MSILSATTLRERASAKDVPVETVRQGAAKAWGNVNQTGTQSVLDSFNVSSIVDNGIGSTTFNLSAIMANSNYAYSFNGSFANFKFGATPTTRTAALVQATFYNLDANADLASACFSINGQHS